MRSSRIAAVVAAGVGVLGMGAPASAMTQGPAMGASEGVNVALAPGHERPLALGAVERSQPRPARAGLLVGQAKPKADPKQDVVPGLDLSIGKSHIGPFKQGEHNATYMITVSNLGSIPAGGFFSVTDYLPASMTATSISGVGWDCTLATLTCDRFGVLFPATQFPTIYLTADVADDAPEVVTNTATLTADVNIGPPVVATATDPTRILSGDEDRGSGKGGGVNIKIENRNNNHNHSTALNLNLNHTSAHAAAAQEQAQAQGTSVKTKVHTKVNTKLHVHNTNVAVVSKSRHHHEDR